MEQAEMSKRVVVDGVAYLVSHPQVETAWEIGVELVKMIGAPAASMAQGVEDKNKAGDALVGAVTGFLQKLDPKTSMGLIKKLLANVECQGPEEGPAKKTLLNEQGIKLHFHGRIGSMMRLTGEAVAFTHADFFDAIADGVAAIMKKASDKLAA